MVGAVFGKALSAIATLEQEGFTASDSRQTSFQIASLASKHQRREGRQLAFGFGER